MILYHGSYMEVVEPKLIESEHTLLKVRKLYNQYVFKSVRALRALKFVGSEVVS